jgi:hypothetical protein
MIEVKMAYVENDTFPKKYIITKYDYIVISYSLQTEHLVLIRKYDGNGRESAIDIYNIYYVTGIRFFL